MKYLITGSSGFVGAHLVCRIRNGDAGATIIGIDREASASAPVDQSYVLDLLQLGPLSELLRVEQPDYLVHLASVSSVGFSWQEPTVSFTNNTNIFLNVLEAVREHSPRTRILSVGSSEQFGLVTSADLPLTERSPMRPLSPYAVARIAQEQLGDVYVRGFGLDIVATRSFNHLGPGQSDRFVVSAIGRQFAEVAKGTRQVLKVGTTSVIRDFLDVRDVVDAYCLLLAKGERGEAFNICSGRGTSIAGIIELFSTMTGLRPPIETDPALVRPVENEIVVGSHEKITQAIGWKPTYLLEDTLRSVFDYWNSRV